MNKLNTDNIHKYINHNGVWVCVFKSLSLITVYRNVLIYVGIFVHLMNLTLPHYFFFSCFSFASIIGFEILYICDIRAKTSNSTGGLSRIQVATFIRREKKNQIVLKMPCNSRRQNRFALDVVCATISRRILQLLACKRMHSISLHSEYCNSIVKT